jgi:hypothetical protein
MRSLILSALAVATALPVLSQPQTPRPFVPPDLKGERSVIGQAALAAPSTSPASLYQNRHEAAIAALKAANQTAALGRGLDPVIGLLLIAAKRDPHFGKVVYDLGLSCAKEERWADAIRFYQRVPQVDTDPDVAKLAAAELERAQLLGLLESTPEGKRRRQFESGFLEASRTADRDPVMALESLNQLAALDAARWEVPALRGVLQASLGDYAASMISLQNAARLAPAGRRPALLSAADLARREATYVESEHNAELAWEKQDWETSAKLYSTAWETSPGRVAVGMQAAVAFLMADKVGPAVETLTRIVQAGSPEYDAKARAMLRELGTVSTDAAHAATMEQSTAPGTATPGVVVGIRKLVGDLTSPQMLLIGKTPPPFLEDNTSFIAIPDAELNEPGTVFDSNYSVFAQYDKVTAELAAPSAAGNPASPTEQPSAAPPAADTAPLQVPGRPATLSSRLDVPAPARARGPERDLAINSQPAGGSVVLDNDASTTCRTPCQVTVSPGRHTLVATLGGYRDILKIVNIDKSGAVPPTELAFEKKQGVVEVIGGAPGSGIWLDGNRTDQTTPGKLAVLEGDHEIAIESNGEMLKKTVHVHDNDWVKITF